MIAENVLLMDESLAVQAELRDAFETRGYRLHSVRDEASARRAVTKQEFKAAIFGLDWGRDDQRIRRRELLHEASRACPVVVLADGERLETRLSVLREGVADFISKPYHATYVVKRVRETVHAARAPGGPHRILVVDDSLTYGNAVSNALSRDGHDVVLATTGREAEDYLALQRPDAIFLDVFLPDVDGIDLARRVRSAAATRDLPILLLTGRESTRVRERAAEANVSDFAAKNTPLDDLRARVAGLVASGKPGAQRREAGTPVRGGSLFDAVVAASGLSAVLGRSTLALAFKRAGIDPIGLTPERLKAALPRIDESLKTFLSPTDATARIAAIEALCRESEGTR